MNFLQTQFWIGCLTLTALEIVLGVDNIVFITILVSKLPHQRQEAARRIGLILALIPRLLLLLTIPFVQSLVHPLLPDFPLKITGQGLVLLIGGLFLLVKSTREIHEKLEGDDSEFRAKAHPAFGRVIIQIMLLNLVFSIDSVITAIGMTADLWVMVISVVASTAVMLAASSKVGHFVERHPTIKMLALSFLLLIGTNLIAEALGYHIPKGYTYFAMAFSLAVEMLNLRMRAKHAEEPIQLHGPLNVDQHPENPPRQQAKSGVQQQSQTARPGTQPSRQRSRRQRP